MGVLLLPTLGLGVWEGGVLREGSEALIQEELPSSCLNPSVTVPSPRLLPLTRSSNLEGTLGVPGLAGNPYSPLPHFSWTLPSRSSHRPSCPLPASAWQAPAYWEGLSLGLPSCRKPWPSSLSSWSSHHPEPIAVLILRTPLYIFPGPAAPTVTSMSPVLSTSPACTKVGNECLLNDCWNQLTQSCSASESGPIRPHLQPGVEGAPATCPEEEAALPGRTPGSLGFPPAP